LSISKEFIEALGGSIKVKSDLALGSSFLYIATCLKKNLINEF
jgi:signal transduction histidine kinase